MKSQNRIEQWRMKKKEGRKKTNNKYFKNKRQHVHDTEKEEKNRKNREYVKKHRDKSSALMGPGGDAGTFSNRMSKHRALKRVEEALPSDKSKRISLITNLLSRHVSSNNTVIDNDKNTDSAVEAVIHDINSTIKQVKHKRNESARTLVNVIAASVNGDEVLRGRAKTSVARRLGLHPRRLGRKNQSKRIRTEVLHNETSAIKFTKRKTRNDKLDDTTRKLAYDFWLKSEISRPTGNKSDVKRVRLGPNIYTSHMIHVLEKSQEEAFKVFKNEHPHVKIGLRTFESCKPYFVRQTRQKDRTTCCCRYHVEAQSVFKAAMGFRRNETNGDAPVYDHLDDMVSTTLCDTGIRTLKCYDRKCDKCGMDGLHIMDEEMSKADTAPDVYWQKYEYMDIKVKGNATRKKLTLTKQTTKPGNMFEHLAKCIETYSLHQYSANWQSLQLKNLKENLPMNHVICIHDYSENYRCREKSEIQADYFQRTEVSLHVTLLHRHAIVGVDGVDSTEENPVIITEQFFTISEDLRHDQYFTREVQRQISIYLRNIGYEARVMHEWTDGCAQQYKSRHCFGDLSVATHDLGYDTLLRNFFETSHGKGPHDAAGGYIKAQADLAVTRGQTLIQNAHDLYLFGTKRLSAVSTPNGCKRRIFVYTEAIPRNDDCRFKSVPNIRSIHQLITCGNGNLKTRRLSCYSCDNCMDARYDFCQNTEMTGQFRLFTMESDDGSVDGTNEIDDMEATTALKDQVTEDTVVAVLADDDERPYYLFKSSGPLEILEEDETDDFGALFYSGSEIIRGHYFDYMKTNSFKYRIIPNKLALVPAVSVRYIFSDTNGVSCRRLTIDEPTHSCILGRLMI